MLFIGPLLFGAAIFRAFQADKEGLLVKFALVLAAFFFAAAATVSLCSILYPRNPTQLLGALQVKSVFWNQHFAYLMVMFGFVLVLQLSNNKLILRNISYFAILIALVYLFKRSLWFSAPENYFFRALSGALLALIIVISILSFFSSERYNKCFNLKREAKIVIFLIYITLCYPFYIKTVGFYQWAKQYEHEATIKTGVLQVEKTQIDTAGYFWSWTNPALSILLRGDNGVIFYNKDEDWQNFNPEIVDKNPLSSYKKYFPLYK